MATIFVSDNTAPEGSKIVPDTVPWPVCPKARALNASSATMLPNRRSMCLPPDTAEKERELDDVIESVTPCELVDDQERPRHGSLGIRHLFCSGRTCVSVSRR